MPRAWPSLSVALASLLTNVASTAASSGRLRATTAPQPIMDRDQPSPRARPGRWSRASRRLTYDQPVAVHRSITPQPVRRSPDRCRGCESGGPSSLIPAGSPIGPACTAGRARLAGGCAPAGRVCREARNSTSRRTPRIELPGHRDLRDRPHRSPASSCACNLGRFPASSAAFPASAERDDLHAADRSIYDPRIAAAHLPAG